MTSLVKLVVRGECLPPTRPPHTLRCQCGFTVVSQTIGASILALTDHRAHAHIPEARA